MSKEPRFIDDDVVVEMSYVLHSQAGREIDRSVSPLAFIQGRDQILPGLGEALYGMSAGEEKVIVVAPADGYGAYDAYNLQCIPRSALPAGYPLTLGQGVSLQNQETGHMYRAYVVEIGPDYIILDHNLPLAGQTLRFHVQILALRRATSGELATGLS